MNTFGPNRGFTIAELLIVIVIIGILAVLTLVSYTGISQKALIASIQSDLSTSVNRLKLYYTDNGQYPQDLALSNSGYCPTTPVDARYCLKISNATTMLSYSSSSPYSSFTLTAKNGAMTYIATEKLPPAVAQLAANISVSVSGAGGGGGARDSGQNATAGAYGDLVATTVAVTSGDTFTFIIGHGGIGAVGGENDGTGEVGGAGYTNGYNGRDGYNAENDIDWAYGGGGGGASSGIKRGTTRLVEAAGGAGGRSADWTDGDVFCAGGGGGAGGGSNYPSLTTQHGGGMGTGADGGSGGNGSITISYLTGSVNLTVPGFTPTISNGYTTYNLTGSGTIAIL